MKISQMDRSDARNLLMDLGIYRESDGMYPDFHALPAFLVFDLVGEAKLANYRTPRNYSGSRGRAFYAALVRKAGKE